MGVFDMAKFADYVSKQDQEINTELAESVAKRSIPESVVKRFDGKSVEDILESYANLEQEFSRRANETSELRRTVDDLVKLQLNQSNTSQAVTAEPAKPITVDDLYTDPADAIKRAVDPVVKESAKRVESLEKSLNEMNMRAKIADLTARYPEWKSDAQSPEFRTWVNESRARERLAVTADRGDLDAANDLFELWYSHRNLEQQVEKRVQREDQFRAASLESSSPGVVNVADTLSRSMLLEKRLAAKRGDRAAERWLNAHAESIAIAYEEGRLVD
jgi:hypothetical protein